MVKKQLYSEQFCDRLYTEIMLLEQLMNELDNSNKKKQIQKEYQEKLRYLNYLCD